MRNRILLSLSLAVVATASVGCGEAVVPARPSWDQDVFPILQGSCNHCHGETVGQPGRMSMPVGRLDICSVEPFAAAQIMVPNATTDALTWARADMIVSRVKTAPKAARPNMPPPPAAPLSDYDVEVLTKWVAQVKATTATPGELHPACRKQVRNRDPQAKRVGKAEVVDGSLSVTIDVSDIDGDQVLGKISAGSGDAQPIPGTGRRTFQFAGASADTKLNLVLHDGYSQVDLEL